MLLNIKNEIRLTLLSFINNNRQNNFRNKHEFNFISRLSLFFSNHKIFLNLCTVSICLLVASCSKNDHTIVLENRNGLKYEINSETPFTGKYITYYNNGQKKTESNFTDGKENGLVTWWYENGQKELEENYKFGKKTGLRIEWYENGRKRREQIYKYDKRDGLMITWDNNGNITGMETYKNDVLAKKAGLKYGLYQ